MTFSHQSKTPSRLAKWSLIVGIIIVLNMFFNYAISLFYKEPQYPSSQPQVVEQYQTKEDCLAVGGQWNQNSYQNDYRAPDVPVKGYCDPDYSARIAYEAAHKTYQRNVFIMLMTLGIVALVIGVFAAQDVLAAAFSWGGVLSLLIASMRYWSAADNVVKVLLLAVALGGLIWTAIKKFGRM